MLKILSSKFNIQKEIYQDNFLYSGCVLQMKQTDTRGTEDRQTKYIIVTAAYLETKAFLLPVAN